MKPHWIPFTRLFRPDLGIDLGSTATLICAPGQGIVLEEPTLVALEMASDRVLRQGRAVGHLASIMHGRAPDSFRMVRPVRGGVVADFHACQAMLRSFVRKATRRRWCRPRMLIAVPASITPVERQALLSAAVETGAGHVSLVDKPLMAGLGAGLNVTQTEAQLVCDLGGGTTEVAVLCLGEMVLGQTLRIAGEDLDQAIADYMRQKHRLRVGLQMAERIKLQIGAAVVQDPDLQLEVGGQNLVSGLPQRTVLAGSEVRESIQDPLRAILCGVHRVLESCPEALAADLMENGMVLVGGGARLRGLDQLMAQATGIPVRVAEEPERCVARGLGICLENLDVWHRAIRSRCAA